MSTLDIFSISEHRLQHIVRLLFSNSEYIWHTVTGKPLQVISPGEWNSSAGPDFRNMALLVGGRVVVGHGEFHKRSSEWKAHGHHADANYGNVLLHVVLQDDSAQVFAEHTVQLPIDMVLALLRAVPEVSPTESSCSMNGEELQEYAYRRLLRKTAQALELCRTLSPEHAFAELARQFLDKRLQKKTRPQGARVARELAASPLERSVPAQLAGCIATGQCNAVFEQLSTLVRTAWSNAGKATQMEIVVNALLPVALAVAPASLRIDILAWFWSQRSTSRYSVLRKKFPDVAQEYVWQQQGMLEYIATQTFGPDRVAEPQHDANEMEARRRLSSGITIRLSFSVLATQ